MREFTKLLKVLSDDSRLRVLNLLQERECCVCKVMQVMDISQSKASRILSALYDVGLLSLRREGRWALYSVEMRPGNIYVDDILSGVKKALSANPVAAEDIERLKKAERVGPACIAGTCQIHAAAAEASERRVSRARELRGPFAAKGSKR